MRLYIKRANIDQLCTIIGLLDNAADWLHHDKGLDQWPRPHPAPEERNKRLSAGLRSGRTWICWDGPIAVATVTAEEAGDPKLWTAQELAEPAVYVHRLVVARSYAGQAIGSALMDWAGVSAAEGYGARWIRVDVWTTNTQLHAYYERQGFIFVRKHDDPANPSGVMFQKSTTDLVTKSELSRIFVVENYDKTDNLPP